MDLQASIDIGTNTVLLLIGRVNNDKVEVVHEEQRVPRLGRGVDGDKKLSQAGMIRVIESLIEYKSIIRNRYPCVSRVTVTATSAVRDATNKNEFLKKVKHQTGWEIRVLSGTYEAEWTYAGALSVLGHIQTDGRLVLDIGGGSTEIAFGKHLQLMDSHSFNMGCVRFTERYLKHDPPTDKEISECMNQINDILASRQINYNANFTAIGVAGTLTSLAYMDLNLKKYDPARINGHILTRGKIQKYIQILSEMTHSQMIKEYPEVMEGRADIFIAGILILDGFMGYYNQEKIIVSTGGIRHGALQKG